VELIQEMLSSKENMLNAALENFEDSKKYKWNVLDKRRKEFLT
jgi:hypothetical protein